MERVRDIEELESKGEGRIEIRYAPEQTHADTLATSFNVATCTKKGIWCLDVVQEKKREKERRRKRDREMDRERVRLEDRDLSCDSLCLRA